MNFEDITVVVQGPVQTFQDRPQEPNITTKCLQSVRTFLPGAKIILSTWPDQDLSGLDYDELVITPDPGPNSRNYTEEGEPQQYNNNRQIVSSREGLKRVTTKYTVKLRSDNFLTSNKFVELQQRYTKRSELYTLFKERVVVSDVFTRKYAKGFPVAFHVSDFFYFGCSEDVLALWSMPLFENYQSDDSRILHKGYPNFMLDCTQALFLSALQQLDSSIELEHLLDNDKVKLEQSEQIIANNLVFASLDVIGLGLCQKFLGAARVHRTKGKVAHYQFFEWLELYRRYCDPHVEMPSNYWLEKLKLFLLRCWFVFPTRLETQAKLKKRALQLSR